MAISNDVLEGPDSGTRSAASRVSVGVLSFGALQTISQALKAHRESGLIDCAGEFFVHFNAITPEDKSVAEEAGVSYSGTAENCGIYGGLRAIAERARNPYVLILENDVVPCPARGCANSGGVRFGHDRARRQVLQPAFAARAGRRGPAENISRRSALFSRLRPVLPRSKPRLSPGSECSWSTEALTSSGRRRSFVSAILRQYKRMPFASFQAAII